MRTHKKMSWAKIASTTLKILSQVVEAKVHAHIYLKVDVCVDFALADQGFALVLAHEH